MSNLTLFFLNIFSPQLRVLLVHESLVHLQVELVRWLPLAAGSPQASRIYPIFIIVVLGLYYSLATPARFRRLLAENFATRSWLGIVFRRRARRRGQRSIGAFRSFIDDLAVGSESRALPG